MYILRMFASAGDSDRNAANYEWAEYNLPAAPDLTALREHIERQAGSQASTSA